MYLRASVFLLRLVEADFATIFVRTGGRKTVLLRSGIFFSKLAAPAMSDVLFARMIFGRWLRRKAVE